MKISHRTKILAIFTIVVIVAKIFTSTNFFFWDTIQLGAKHALFYYNEGLKFELLPNSIDSGHIPFFGYYLAVIWEIFGKSLIVSHFAMLPFLIGIVFQLYKLLAVFFEEKNIVFVMALVFADPSISCQMLLISPDIFLLFFFLLTINAVLSGKKSLKIIGAVGLCLISMRGMIVLFSVFIVDIFNLIRTKKSSLKSISRATLYYLPAALLSICFFVWHYLHKGWFGFHSGSPWASSFQISNIKEIMYNTVILVWRFVDFGRAFLWLFFIGSLVFLIKGRILKNEKIVFFLKYFIAFILVNLPVWILFRSLEMHRYLLTGFLLFSVIVALIAQEYYRKYSRIYFLSLILLLISGNLWVYPDKISTGWDATLAHLPYYSLHENMLNYMDRNKIPVEETGSAFPNIGEPKYIYLSESNNSKFASYDFERNKYIFQSNVLNDFSDEDLDTLTSQWELLKEYKKAKVYIRLYKNPKYE